jgi:hypothetical protein
MKKLALFAFIYFQLIAQSFGQEKLYLKNQREPINCQVIEINSTEVKYKPSDAEQLVIGVNKSEMEKIVFKSGRIQYFTDPLEDFNYYKGQKKWNLKVGILSPAAGFTDLYLEKSLKPGRSVEFQATIIGLGVNPVITNQYSSSNQEITFDQKGGTIGVGLKVLRMPDFELANRKLLHILQGGYLKPAFTLGYYQRNIPYIDPNTYLTQTKVKGIVTSLISVSVGKQWILDNTFSIDIYALMGLGIDNFRRQQENTKKDLSGGFDPSNYEDVLPYRNFGYTRFGRGDAGVAIGGGVKIGYLFNTKKKQNSKGLDKMKQRLNQ